MVVGVSDAVLVVVVDFAVSEVLVVVTGEVEEVLLATGDVDEVLVTSSLPPMSRDCRNLKQVCYTMFAPWLLRRAYPAPAFGCSSCSCGIFCLRWQHGSGTMRSVSTNWRHTSRAAEKVAGDQVPPLPCNTFCPRELMCGGEADTC